MQFLKQIRLNLDYNSPLETRKFKEIFEDPALRSQVVLTKANELISDKFEYSLEGSELTRPSIKVANYIRSQLFIALMAELEDFLSQLLTLVLLSYPCQIEKNFKIKEIVDAGEFEKFISEAVENEIYGFFMLKSPAEYHQKIQRVLKIDQSVLEEVWQSFIEMKARRDVGLHNGWKKNRRYEQKVRQIGVEIPITDFLQVDIEYFLNALNVGIEIIGKLNAHSIINFEIPTSNEGETY